MSRLIEAGKILDNLSGMLKNMDDYDAVKKVINDMPTAYDVDAVVEQLEDYSDADEAEGTIPVIELTKTIPLARIAEIDGITYQAAYDKYVRCNVSNLRGARNRKKIKV